MEQQHKECVFKDRQATMRRGVPTQCGITKKFTCASVMVISVIPLTRSLHHGLYWLVY